MINDVSINNSYEQRIVAFIDVLGFSELVNKLDQYEYVFDLVNDNFMLEQFIKDEQKKKLYDTIEVTCFSDSIVISSELSQNLTLSSFLAVIHKLMINMFKKRIPVRGGITYGNLYHKGQIVFGPAMVKAYKLENKSAIYPRIILEEKDYNDILNSIHDSTFNGKRYIKNLLKRDSDGFYYFNYFDITKNIDGHEKERELYLARIRETIINGFEEADKKGDFTIRQKYSWMAEKYNRIDDLDKFSFVKIIY